MMVVAMAVSGCGDGPNEAGAEDARDSLADALESAGLDTVASALEDVDLASLADGDGFTFFAPNDEAFTALSGDELADLLGDLDQLDDVMGNHIVAERLDAAALAERDRVTTQSGAVLEVAIDADGSVGVNGASVVEADLEAGDGVVHVVDALITAGT